MVFLAYIRCGVFGGAQTAGLHGNQSVFRLYSKKTVKIQSRCNPRTRLRAVNVNAFTTDPG
jgi:hypothetical protein